MEVTSVTVLPADEEPADNLDGVPGEPGIDEGTVADWLPGIRDEHEDEAGWQARWLDRPTWDRTVTPNIRKRTGQRPGRRGSPVVRSSAAVSRRRRRHARCRSRERRDSPVVDGVGRPRRPDPRRAPPVASESLIAETTIRNTRADAGPP